MKENEQVYKMTFNAKQLSIMSDALEEYFRLRVGQFEMLTEDLLKANLGEIDKNNIDKYCDLRDEANSLFKAGYETIVPVSKAASDDARIALDIEHVLKYRRWLDSGIKTEEDYTVDSNKPMQFSSEELPVIENINKTENVLVYRPRIEAYAQSGKQGVSYRRWHEADVLDESKVKNNGTYKSFKKAFTAAMRFAKDIEKGKYDYLLENVYNRLEFGNIKLQACIECHDAYSFEQVNVIPIQTTAALCDFCKLKESFSCPHFFNEKEKYKTICKTFDVENSSAK